MFFSNHGWRQLKRGILIVVGLSLFACQNGEGKEKLSKGADKDMKTYPMGRFSIDVPVSMKQEIQEQRIRSCDVNEFAWPTGKSKDEIRNEIFKTRLTEINKLERPEKVKKIIMEDRTISETGQWARGIFYYGNHHEDDEGFWDVLVDTGSVGIWLKFDGLIDRKEQMLQRITEMAKKYQYLDHKNSTKLSAGNWFYLKHGAFNLPFLRQEHTYSRFVDHKHNLKLEISMDETNEVEKTSLVDSIGQFLISNATPGLDIKKIRSQRRKAAGLKGEEIVLKMTEEGESTLRFRWQYQGKENSGDHPEIEINMESPDDNLEEKLKIWDAVLDSMKPMFERKN